MIETRRRGFLRWEATRAITAHSWVVAYGRTRRGTRRKLKAMP